MPKKWIMEGYTFLRYDRIRITATPPAKRGTRKLSSSEGPLYIFESLYKDLGLKRGWEGPLTICTRDEKRWYIAFEKYQNDDYDYEQALDTGDLGHWHIFDGDLVNPHHVGFIYVIHTRDGKHYIGQKRFSQPDWKNYTGSTDRLDEYKYEDLHCVMLYSVDSIGQLNYYEAMEIWMADALANPDFLNGWVDKVYENHLGKEFDRERHKRIRNLSRMWI